MKKHVALFEVKALEGTDPNGEFEAVLSVPVVDRDGEVVDAGCFNPLPAEIPIHKFHDFSSPVATAVPFYDGDVLKAKGVFDPDADSQAIRQKVGRSIRYMSVGFMAAERADQEGVPHITKAELLEASFVSVPSNREAAILAVKAAQAPTISTSTMGAGPVVTYSASNSPYASNTGTIAIGSLMTLDDARQLRTKAGRVFSAKNEASLRQAVNILTGLLEQLAAPEDESAADKSAATDPEEKAAAPAAASEDAAAAAAAQPPAEASAGHQLRVALLRLEADLAAMNAAH